MRGVDRQMCAISCSVFLSLARGGRFVPQGHNSRDFKAGRPPRKYLCQSLFDELVKDGRLRVVPHYPPAASEADKFRSFVTSLVHANKYSMEGRSDPFVSAKSHFFDTAAGVNFATSP